MRKIKATRLDKREFLLTLVEALLPSYSIDATEVDDILYRWKYNRVYLYIDTVTRKLTWAYNMDDIIGNREFLEMLIRKRMIDKNKLPK